MEKYNNTIESLLKVHNKLALISKKPRDFGSGKLLYSTEIHTIIVIKENPGINLTNLSDILGVSKSAVFKFVKKLLDKNYIIKNKSIDNQKEVMFNLTDKGRIVFQGHKNFSNEKFKKVYEILNEIDENKIFIINDFLEKLSEELTQVK